MVETARAEHDDWGRGIAREQCVYHAKGRLGSTELQGGKRKGWMERFASGDGFYRKCGGRESADGWRESNVFQGWREGVVGESNLMLCSTVGENRAGERGDR